jgi:ubiquinone/menaquinone biosynthesis C-methylase UbiE
MDNVKYKNNFTSKEVGDFWNSVVDIYEEANGKVQDIHDQRYLEALEHINPQNNLKVLNLWSRMGRSLKYFRPKFLDSEIVNMEISTDMLNIAKERYPDENFYETDLVTLANCENNYFDRIISLETLEHSPSPMSLINEFYRVLKPGGTCVMSLPPATAEIILVIYELFVENHGEGPHKFLSYKKVSKMLQETNFELIEHHPTIIIPFGNKYMKKLNAFCEKHYKKLFLQEFGLRHFYILKKPV